MPTTANGGITDGGKTYTFHIKQGVDWNTSPARQVTSQDFLREFKAFYNPVQPVGAPFYYNAMIAGLQAYDNAETAFFAKKSNAPTAANITNFQNTHTISGISTPNSSTLVFHLIQPAADFIYMLAMPFSSARPVEYDNYVPDSVQFRQHTISDGPYQITQYVPGKSLSHEQEPGLEAIHRHGQAPVRQPDHGDVRRHVPADPAGRPEGRHLRSVRRRGHRGRSGLHPAA